MDTQIVYKINELIELFGKKSSNCEKDCDCFYCLSLMELKYLKKDFIILENLKEE